MLSHALVVRGFETDERVKAAYERLLGGEWTSLIGGVVMERAALDGITVHPDGAWMDVSPAPGPGGQEAPSADDAPAKVSRAPGPVTARLVVDCMVRWLASCTRLTCELERCLVSNS